MSQDSSQTETSPPVEQQTVSTPKKRAPRRRSPPKSNSVPDTPAEAAEPPKRATRQRKPRSQSAQDTTAPAEPSPTSCPEDGCCRLPPSHPAVKKTRPPRRKVVAAEVSTPVVAAAPVVAPTQEPTVASPPVAAAKRPSRSKKVVDTTAAPTQAAALQTLVSETSPKPKRSPARKPAAKSLSSVQTRLPGFVPNWEPMATGDLYTANVGEWHLVAEKHGDEYQIVGYMQSGKVVRGDFSPELTKTMELYSLSSDVRS